MLGVCDLSTDGCFHPGLRRGAVVAINGHPILAIPAAMGPVFCPASSPPCCKPSWVESLLAGIIVNTGLYTINIVIMGKSTLSLNDSDTVFTALQDLLEGTPLRYAQAAGGAALCGSDCRSAAAVFEHPAGPVHPGHRQQPGHGQILLH